MNAWKIKLKILHMNDSSSEQNDFISSTSSSNITMLPNYNNQIGEKNERKKEKRSSPIVILFFILTFISFHENSRILKGTINKIQHQPDDTFFNFIISNLDIETNATKGDATNIDNGIQTRQNQDLDKEENAKNDNTTTNDNVSIKSRQTHNEGNQKGEQNDKAIVMESKIAGLSCDRFGGPRNDLAQEMVYWQDVPSDALYVSPFQRSHTNNNNNNKWKQYLTFEPDKSGWNNKRMAYETIVTMAFAMGRTLVIPPITKQFSFYNYYPLNEIHNEHLHNNIITMKEFLLTIPMNGFMKYKDNNTISFPPENRTDWDNIDDIKPLYNWLRSVSYQPIGWNRKHCVVVFPKSNSNNSNNIVEEENEIQLLENYLKQNNKSDPINYYDNPISINNNTSIIHRFHEISSGRSQLCIYNNTMQQEQYIHYPIDFQWDTRLLIHFYAFLFFQNYKIDLWMKRFVRDHLRYNDSIQCAAARVVARVRQDTIQYNPIHNPTGIYDSLHVRRGDFKHSYKRLIISSEKLLNNIQKRIPINSSIFIATDEYNITYFDTLQKSYHIMFLNDYIKDELQNINSEYYGHIDALVASRGRIFFGCWLSTFTSYITRIRGYQADVKKLPGFELGILNSTYYYAPDPQFDTLQHYSVVWKPYYAREYPAAWRLLDTTVDEPI